ncbi:MAG: hypothetical protein H0W84_08215, partial [Bacteroidetes bacterium]|nr:hypothetical protein [Bacteroidota bacterium]
MIKLHLKYCLLLMCVFTVLVNSLVAQVSSLDSMTLISVGKYNPTVTDANKINNNPVINDTTKKIPVKGYGINSKKVDTGFEVESITAAQMVGEPLTKLYNALVKIGIGTYTTPYGELWYNSLRSKESAYGLHFKHLSSSSTLANYGYAGFSDNEFNLYGKKFLKEHSLIGNFDYARNVVHFYGYDIQKNSLTRQATEQRFNYFAANAELLSHFTKLQRYNHDIKLSYYNLSDYYKSSENNIKANGFVQTTINKELFKVNGTIDFYNYKTERDTINN